MENSSFDTLIFGGGAAGLSCALVLGSAYTKPFAENKKIGIVTHQKNSHLTNALFNNVLGLHPGTTGLEILESGKKQLANLYPHIKQIDSEKVMKLERANGHFIIQTNKKGYTSKIVVVAVGYTNLMNIKIVAFKTPYNLYATI